MQRSSVNLKKGIWHHTAPPGVSGSLCRSMLMVLFVLLMSAGAYAQTWTGNTSTAWGTASNWSTGVVPTSGTDVIITATPTLGRFPVIASGTYAVRALTINSGATLTHSGGTLTLAGNLTNSGTFAGTGGTLQFSGTTSIISGAGTTAFGTLNVTDDVTINNTVTCTGLSFASSGNITLTQGSLSNLTVNGNATVPQPSSNNRTNTWAINAGRATVTGTITLASNVNSGRYSVIELTTGTLNANNIAFNSHTSRANSAVINLSGGAGTLNISGAITLTNTSGTITPGTNSIVNFNGTSAQTITPASSIVFNNVHINNTAGVSPGVALTASTITGNLRVQSGTFSNAGYAITGAATKTFEVASGATFNITGTSTMVAGFGAKAFGLTSTVNYTGTTQTVGAAIYGNLILSGSGTKTISACTVQGNFSTTGTTTANAAGIIDFNGSVTIAASTTFNAGAYSHALEGDFTNSGTFTPSTSTFTLNGAGTQTLSCATAFYNLVNDKVSGSTILATDITVSNVLTLTFGNIDAATNSKNLYVSSSASAAIVRTGGHIIGNLKRQIANTGSITYLFPLGTTAGYLPATIAFTTLGGSTGTLTGAAVTGDHASAAATLNTAKSLNAYWTFNPQAATFSYTNYSISCGYTSALYDAAVTASALKLKKYTASAWSSLTINGTPTSTAIASTASVTSFGDIIVGEDYPATTVSTITPASYCAGAAVSVPFTKTVIFNPGNVFTAQLSNASGSFASPTSIGTLSGTAVGTISATIPAGAVAGTGYRIRVVSSNPVTTGADNGANITVMAPTITTDASAAVVCYNPSSQSTTLAYSATIGSPVTYSITWNAAATSAGFAAVTDVALPAGSITISVPAGLAVGTYTGSITVKSSAGCTGAASSFTVQVGTPSVGSTVSSNQSVCTGNIPATLTVSGHTGNVIKWQKSSVADFSSGVTDIARTGTTLLGTAIGALTSTTYFRAVVQNGSCNVAYSSAAAITVSPASSGGTVSNLNMCAGGSLSALTLSGHNGSVVKWQKSTTAAFSSGVTDIVCTSTTLPPGSMGTVAVSTYFRAVVQSGTCAVAYSVPGLISVGPLPTISIGAGNSVCFSSSAQITSLRYSGTTNSPTSYSITWDAAGTTAGFAAVTNATLAGTIKINVPAAAPAAVYTGTITVRNNAGCVSSPQTFSIAVNSPLVTGIIATQAVTTRVFTGTTGNQIICVEMSITGSSCHNSTVSSISFNTTGTSGSTNPLADISAAKVYFTGKQKQFDMQDLYGTVTSPNGAFTVTGSKDLNNGAGTYYFWLTYDIKPTGTAIPNDLVDARATSLTFAGNVFPLTTNPTGSRVVSPTVYHSISAGNWNNTNIWSLTQGGASCGCAPTLGYGQANVYHAVSVNNNYTIDEVKIYTGGNLTNTSGRVLTVTNELSTSGTGLFNATDAWVLNDVTTSGTGGGTVVASTINGDLNIGTGTTFNMNANIYLKGNLKVNGTLNTGVRIITLNDTLGKTISGTGSVTGTGFLNCDVNKLIPTGTNLTFTASMGVMTGDTVTNEGTIIMQNNLNGAAASSLWVNAENSVLEMSGVSPVFLTTGGFDASADYNTVIYSGSGTQNVKAGTYYNVTFRNNTKTLLGAITAWGDLTIDNSGRLDVSASNYGITLYGNWINNSANAYPFYYRLGTVTFADLCEIQGTSTSAFNHILIPSTGYLKGHATAGKFHVAGNFTNNLTFNHNNSDVTFIGLNAAGGSNTNNILGDGITLFNNIIIASGNTFVSHPVEMHVAGNITNNGTMSPASGIVIFNGNGNTQTIGGTTYGGFFDMEINKPSGSITLAMPVYVGNSLLLTNGLINSDATNFMAIYTTSEYGIPYASANSYINGPLRRYVPTSLTSSAAEYFFPVGKGGSYYPVSFNTLTTGLTQPTITVEAFNTAAGGTGDVGLSTLSTTEHWLASFTGNYTNGKISLTRPTEVISLNAIARSATKTGTYSTLNGSSGGNSINNSDLTGASLGYFMMATNCSPPDVTDFATSGAAACQGSASTVTITSGTMLDGTYNVTYNLSAPNAATGSTASMIFADGTGTFTTSALASTGNTTITITAIRQGTSCSVALSSGNTSVIAVNGAPTVANAGPNQSIPSLTPSVTLAANTPVVGTGTWSVVGGPSMSSGQFSNASNPTATFTHGGGSGTYILRWTIASSPCTASTSDVTITVVPPANVGYTGFLTITIDESRVYGASNFVNFPFLISANSNILKSTTNGGSVQNVNGYDIIFMDQTDMVQLDHQIESYNPATGQYLAWVRIPTLYAATNTVIHLYYGKSGVTTDPSVTGTFNSNYKAVYHLDVNNFNDATGRGNNGTNDGTANITGKIANAKRFNEHYITVPYSVDFDLTGSATFSAWINPEATSGISTILGKQYDISTADNFQLGISADKAILNSSCNATSGISLDAHNWYYVVATATPTSRKVYVNGNEVASVACGTAMTSDNNPVIIGGMENAASGTTEIFLGTIDEPRISIAEHSADWIKTEYYNQLDPAAGIVLQSTVGISWEGDVSTAWLTPGNWVGDKVPTCDDNVIIPAGTPYSPLISVDTAYCHDILLASGATISMTNGAMKVCGDMTLNNAVTFSGGVVKFTGSNEQHIHALSMPIFYRMQMANTASSGLYLHKTVKVTNRLDLIDGNIYTGSDSIILSNPAYTSLTNFNVNSHVVGTLTRYIANNTNTYMFPVGKGTATTYYPFGLVNRNLAGVTYISVTFGTLTRHSNYLMNISDQDITYTYVNNEGIWKVEPDAQPSGGMYDVRCYINNFADLEDNDYGVLKRPSGGYTADWSLGGGTKDPMGSNTRVISGDGSGAGTGPSSTTGIPLGGVYASLKELTSFSEFGVGGGGGSGMPIELLQFDGEYIAAQKAVRLFWSTEIEVSNDYFIVQRSEDGLNFTEVARIDGAGNSTNTLRYEAFDTKPLKGVAYYRLKQIDFDGKYSYSPMIAVTVMVSEVEESVSLYPNPSSGIVNIQFTAKTQGEVSIIVYDLNGRVVQTFSFYNTDDIFEQKLNLADKMTTGQYLIRINGGGQESVTKLSLQQ